MRNIVLALAASLAFSSCQFLLKKAYGIKDPDIESEKTILKKAKKYKFDTQNLATVNADDFLKVLKSIPEASIYDKNGKYIEYRQNDTACNAGLFDFIPQLNLNSTYNQPDSADLTTVLARLRDLKGNTLAPLPQADFYVFIYWSVWTGKLNKDHVKVWEDLAKQNKNCKIQVLKVNLDIQKYWEPTIAKEYYNSLNNK